MSTPPLLSAEECALHDAGHTWDAIRVPHTLGLTAMRILGSRCGAVIVNSGGDTLYFFVSVGTAANWSVEGTRPVGRGSVMAIPAERRTDGPGAHWLICPGEDGWLTDPAALEAALGDSVASHEPE